MPLVQHRRDSLLRYTARLFDQLSGVRPASIRHLLAGALSGLCKRADVPHGHLFLLRTRRDGQQTASLAAQWSITGQQVDRAQLQALEISHFGMDAVKKLGTGTIVFSACEDSKNACSRLVSGILLEINATGYEMFPVQIRSQWCGILALAHDRGPMHLDADSRQVLQLAGKVLVSSLQSARREVRRRSKQRQWKRIADGACDFALSVNESFEIMSIVPFRRKETANVVGLRLDDVFDQMGALYHHDGDEETEHLRGRWGVGGPMPQPRRSVRSERAR